ncbi:methylmalonyl Co-A mutase-associated GTPase MeaB [Rhodohalobacter mucosus]|uniref:Methylmalonyl Co-A mutase-associated GTPase MeaB n=1 Tax=Rhodohalobacter mucosus TaxID=2079485 RepID=A0A316TPK3_9BACT|nr:methylmalonyl Co-A mutase-associated GTPase MeaB [Rhodohalobacter mucosus]PWN05591.1 methylmalonyl Co-A mutase-associated GTPase MeaB [Rhodohalobacter mucosus]
MSDPENSSLHINPGSQNESVNPSFRAKRTPLRKTKDYVEGVLSGDRTILSQAITLIESRRDEHRELGRDILEACLPHAGKSVRIGITGVPGAGKSTFIESLGRHLIEKKGKRLAVLTVDPSSSRSKGSILGDKTRMPVLSTSQKAFIRPSPSSGSLGGVARQTRETMLLCEAAGYDTVFVETVGVGQSEITVHSMTDFFLLILIAGAGDELQGIKRGVMEMADLIAINKSEGDNRQAANRARLDYQNALSLFPEPPSGKRAEVMTCSALNNKGIVEIWEQIEEYLEYVKQTGFFSENRSDQSVHWMYETIHEQLKKIFYGNEEVKASLQEIREKVRSGEISSTRAADDLIRLFKSS